MSQALAQLKCSLPPSICQFTMLAAKVAKRISSQLSGPHNYQFVSEVGELARCPLCHRSHPRQQPTRLCHQRLPFFFAIESHSTMRGPSRWLPSGSSDARHCNTANLCAVIELGTSNKVEGDREFGSGLLTWREARLGDVSSSVMYQSDRKLQCYIHSEIARRPASVHLE